MNVAKKQQTQELSTYINLLEERINDQNHKHTINQDHFSKEIYTEIFPNL